MHDHFQKNMGICLHLEIVGKIICISLICHRKMQLFASWSRKQTWNSTVLPRKARACTRPPFLPSIAPYAQQITMLSNYTFGRFELNPNDSVALIMPVNKTLLSAYFFHHRHNGITGNPTRAYSDMDRLDPLADLILLHENNPPLPHQRFG